MNIVFTCSEFTPLAKTGGLADVCAALSAYLLDHGDDVRVLVPLYREIAESGLKLEPVEPLQNMPIRLGSHEITYSIDTARLTDSDQDICLLRCPELYDRGRIYGDAGDEHRRFILLSRAALEMCRHTEFEPDIMHCHDWHTALVPLFLKTVYASDRLFAKTRTVLTIHNIAYQGIFGADTIDELGLGGAEDELNQEDLRADRINFLKTGVLHADLLTTVSPTYAKEIQTDAYGMGLQGLLQKRSETLVGILNGVDYKLWDPEHDGLIPHTYSARRLGGKKENKTELLAEVGLDGADDRPLIGMVSRLTAQKGIDLIEAVLPEILQSRPFVVVVLGTGEPRYERFFASLEQSFKSQVRFYNGYNNKLAHRIEAGSDMFLMPSHFEPCGLNQMYSMRYGTVPIVHETGGLADTVEPYDSNSKQGTGIVFRHYDEAGLRWAIDTALDLYEDKHAWRQIIRNGMVRDFSWERQGKLYADLYRKLAG
jgi:starch synthase